MPTYVCLGELAEAGMQVSDKAGDARLVHDNLGHINATSTNSNTRSSIYVLANSILMHVGIPRSDFARKWLHTEAYFDHVSTTHDIHASRGLES